MSMINKGPSIMVANNDYEAINIVNGLSGNNYTTIEDALQWVSSQDDIYVQNKTMENIVTDGLVLYLDASNVESYPKTGTIWFDLSGNGHDAIMSNLTSANWVTKDGIKTFETNDTPNQGFRVPSFPFSAVGRTYEIWLNSKSFAIGWQTWFDDNATERILFGTSSNNIQIYPTHNFSGGLVVDTWYQLLYTLVGDNGTNAIAYKNAEVVGSGNYSSDLTSGTGTLYILGDPGSEITSCYCPIVRVYNRVLSPEEILQNYNVTKYRYSMVFGYDLGNTDSYKGEPTTNLSYNYNNTLNQGYDWNNSGNATTIDDDTSIFKPTEVPNIYKIRSASVFATGSIHRGAGVATIVGETEYTLSVYYWQNRAGVGSPYARSPQSNSNLGNLSYGGSSSTSNWPVGKWVRCSVTITTMTGDTNLYISNYIGAQIGDKVAYYCPQIEQKSHMTQHTGPARSVTEGLLDLTGNATIDLSNNVSFDSTAHPIFNGTGNYINTNYGANINPYNNPFSVNMWIKPDSLSNAMFCSSGQGRGNGDSNQRFYLSIYGSNWDWGIRTSGWSAGGTMTPADTNWNMITVTMDPSNSLARFYLNSTQIYTKAIDNAFVLNDNFWIANHDNNYHFSGQLTIFKIYNKALSQEEISYNFDISKDRFGL